MSLMSMTGFGQGESISDQFSMNIEIKSVNHRFRDTRFRMSSLFNRLEMDSRKLIEKEFARGSFDINASYKKNPKLNNEFDLDELKIQGFIKQCQQIIDANMLKVDASTFLKSEFMKTDDQKEVELRELFVKAFDLAIKSLKEKRLSEGVEIKKAFETMINSYEKEFAQITEVKKTFQPALKAKLEKRIEEFQEKLEGLESRMLQEIIFYMEKWDIDEEIIRIQAHLQALKKLVSGKKGVVVGRKIEFLLQELGRETNTIGSKSHSQEISQSVVEMKVQLEKMREQAANVQ